MMRSTRLSIAAGVLMLMMAGPVIAHEGHTHTVQGTVLQQDDHQMQIKTTDGKTVTVTLNAKTTILKGTQKAERAALVNGQRVVVDVGDGKTPLVAKSVKLGVVESTAKSTAKK
jgi:hypothetical protein